MKKYVILTFLLVLTLSACQSQQTVTRLLNLEETKPAVTEISADKKETLNKIITDFYGVYNSQDFDKLADFFAPQVEQYISLKNTTPEAIVSDAKVFFKEKDVIKYEPFLNAMEINNSSVRLGLNMALNWAEKTTNDPPLDTTVDSNVYVVVNINFDENNKIKSYVEEYIVRPQFELTKERELEPVDGNNSVLDMPAGTIVTSDFQTRTWETVSWWKATERKVVYNKNKYWVTSLSYHAADYDNTAEYYLSQLKVDMPAEYRKYFKSQYSIVGGEGNYYLQSLDTDMFENNDVYNFSNEEGDNFELGSLYGGKILDISVIWHPEFIDHKCFNVETKKFLPIENSKGVGMVGNDFYFLQFHNAPFNVYFYYGDDVDRGGYYDQLRAINIKNNTIIDVYTAKFGTLRIKEVTDKQIVLVETIFDKTKELNYQSTPEEVKSVYLGEKDVVISLE